MNIRKIATVGAALVMAAGIFTGVPMSTENASPLAITAEAADSDFVIETDENGDKYVSGYNGSGDDENIIIPDGVKYIGDNAFATLNIASITFPKSCTKVGVASFYACGRLKTVIFEGDAEICDYAFAGSLRIEKVTINGSVKNQIGIASFYDCQGIKTFQIKENKYKFEIKKDAFARCIDLTSINIPNKCVSIGSYALGNCFNLQQITIPADTKVLDDKCLGYASISADEKRSEMEPFVADGKTSGYEGLGWSNEMKKVTPKQLTVYVTKGSPAEKYCKENGVKYAYGKAPAVTTDDTKTSAAKLAAPTGVKGTVSQNKIVLTWNKVSGAEGYRVYKYDEKTGKYLKYKDVKNEKCTVKGLKSGTEYKFKIYALVSENGKFAPQTPTGALSFKTKTAKKSDEPFNDELITL